MEHPEQLQGQALVAAIQAQQLQDQGLLDKFCTKTGKPCGQLSLADVTKTLQIHSLEALKTILPMLQNSVAIEWIFTDADCLSALAKNQPVEYLIYAISDLLPNLRDKSIQEIQRVQNSKKQAWKLLHSGKIPLDAITRAAELCRRLLAKNRPVCLREMLLPLSVSGITSDIEQLEAFCTLLEACLVMIKQGYYEQDAVEQRNKALLKYRAQKQLRFLTDLEISIEQEFDDFEIFQEHPPSSILLRQKTLTKLQKQKITKRKSVASHSAFYSKAFVNPSFSKFKINTAKSEVKK